MEINPDNSVKVNLMGKTKAENIKDAVGIIATALLKADSECGHKGYLHKAFNDAIVALDYLEGMARRG